MVTNETIEKLMPLLKSGADREFFFSSIRTADWLPALLAAGFFKHPPDPIRDGDWVRYSAWPESQYLARVAALAPEVAIQVATSIPETANAGVNEDLVETALAVPPMLAAKLMPKLSTWIRQSHLPRPAVDAGKLIAHVAQGGAIDEALQLFGWLIAFAPDPEKAEKERLHEENKLGWGLQPQTRLSTQDYHQLLVETLPTLVQLNPKKTLRLLADTTNDYIRERFSKDDPEGYDGSVYWRPSIAEHGQNSTFNAITHLISALRQYGEVAVANRSLSAVDLLGLMRSYPWDIFKRFELHWTLVFRDRLEAGAARKLLLTESYLVGNRVTLEYGQLLRAAFASLDSADREWIVTRVTHGPDEGDLEWMRQGPNGEPASPAALEMRINRWRVQRLCWVKDALSFDWRLLYDAWAATGGEPEHPGFQSWVSSVKNGSESPMTVEAFHALSLNGQLEYVRNWEPQTSAWTGPNRAGLAGILQLEIKTDPVRYFEAAEKFRGLDREYVAALFGGFREGIKGKAVSSWNSFWDLAQWILAQPDTQRDVTDELTGRTREGRRWQYPRLEVARFIDATFKGETVVLPLSERKIVWDLIETLTGDPNPTAAEDQERSDSSMEPYTLSLNTVRGEAVHAVFSYIQWCRSTGWEETAETAMLGDVPEARQVLERLLNPEFEPTQTIRTIYGANTSYLAEWADAWLKQNRTRIFPEDGPERLRRVAWETFINNSNPSTKSLLILDQEFGRAIRAMKKSPKNEHRDDPRVSLGRHLVVNYWWGKIELEKPGNLLAEFFKSAPEDVRAETLVFIGRCLRNAPEPAPAAFLSRLIALWEWRLQLATEAKGKGFQEEMAAFAWWFDSMKFNEAWSAKEMVRALELGGSMKDHFLWIRHFADMAERQLPAAVRVLELTVEAAQKGAITFWDDDEAAAILEIAVKSGNPTILASSRRIQSLLLRMGRKRFLTAVPEE